jgi:hypothetical protein
MSSMKETTYRKPFWRWLVPVLALLATLAVSQQFRHQQFARLFLPTGEAEWIWAPGQQHSHQPIAFYAATEFELSFPVVKAELMSLADEESVLFVNGAPVGATRYDDGRPLPAYDVADLLRPGTNRIQVELRSTRGVGAFLLNLEVTGESDLRRIVSDASWNIYRYPVPGLFAFDGELPKGERPEVWGAPPAGRWSVPGEVRQAGTIGQLRVGDQSFPATRWRTYSNDTASDWFRLKRPDRSSPGLGSWITFDFGREVTGYLAFRFPGEAETDRNPLGLIFVGDEPPDAENRRPDAYLVGMVGQRVWLDSEPRQFRYVTFVGLVEASGVEVYPVDSASAAELIDEAGAAQYQVGAFGLRSTRLRTPLENEVWSEFHGFPGTAGGEGR